MEIMQKNSTLYQDHPGAIVLANQTMNTVYPNILKLAVILFENVLRMK